jgi:hypothetical protein
MRGETLGYKSAEGFIFGVQAEKYSLPLVPVGGLVSNLPKLQDGIF